MIAMTDDYRRLSVVQKRALDLSRARDAAVRCPECDMQVMPVDLLSHLKERCAGPPEPGPGAKWVTHREVMSMGVPRATLSFWANSKQVRFIGERQDRRYLLRDLALKIAQRNAFRRR